MRDNIPEIVLPKMLSFGNSRVSLSSYLEFCDPPRIRVQKGKISKYFIHTMFYEGHTSSFETLDIFFPL